MNKEKLELLRQFINNYKQADNKEAFMNMWDEIIPTNFDNYVEEETLTKEDAFNCAYGDGLAQIL